MSAKEFAKQVLVELADPQGQQRTRDADVRRAVAHRIAEQIAEIAPASVGSAEEMQRLAVEAALAEGAPL